MASQSRLFRHPYILTIIGVVLLIGLGLLVQSVLHSTVFEQHASVDQFTAIAVKGSFYVDRNRNGQRDNGEVNYQGVARPRVELALFNTVCGSSPTPTTVPTNESPTPNPTSCYYKTQCIAIACTTGHHDRPCGRQCKQVQVCPSAAPSTQPTTAPSTTPNPNACYYKTVCINVLCVPGHHDRPCGRQCKQVQVCPSAAPSTQPTTENGDTQEAQQEDVCHRTPVKVISCPVNQDGTYECVAEGTTFVDAWIRAFAPARDITTSKNPVSVKGPAASVDFGIASFFPPFGGVGTMN